MKRQNKSLSIIQSPLFLKIGNFLLVSAFLFGGVYSQSAYNWAIDHLVVNSLKTTYEQQDLTIHQRYEAKIGFNYRYLQYIKDNTPEDAIILWPKPADFLKDGAIKPFHDHYIKESVYAAYFLHPRKVINIQDTSNIYYSTANYIAIVHGKGYERLTYPVSTDQQFTVAPLQP